MSKLTMELKNALKETYVEDAKYYNDFNSSMDDVLERNCIEKDDKDLYREATSFVKKLVLLAVTEEELEQIKHLLNK